MPNVLLVEDSPTQQMQMQILLEGGGHHVCCAPDGEVALKMLDEQGCEIVVTDLEMPTLNGLQLIQKLRSDFPHIPSILVTARGSERLAAEALQQGAAAYVPKVLLESLLLKTVEDVLGVMRTDRTYGRLIDSTIQNHFILQLPSEPAIIEPAVDLPIQIAAGMDLLTGTEMHRVSLAVQQALHNALYRGNLELSRNDYSASCGDKERHEQRETLRHRLESEPFCNRSIRYDVLLTRGYLRFIITDEGSGFDVSTVPSKSDAGAMSGEGGRGLVLIQNVMDDVRFNPAGNQISMLYRVRGESFGIDLD